MHQLLHKERTQGYEAVNDGSGHRDSRDGGSVRETGGGSVRETGGESVRETGGGSVRETGGRESRGSMSGFGVSE